MRFLWICVFVDLCKRLLNYRCAKVYRNHATCGTVIASEVLLQFRSRSGGAKQSPSSYIRGRAPLCKTLCPLWFRMFVNHKLHDGDTKVRGGC